jgi:hypothetical protein
MAGKCRQVLDGNIGAMGVIEEIKTLWWQGHWYDSNS